MKGRTIYMQEITTFTDTTYYIYAIPKKDTFHLHGHISRMVCPSHSSLGPFPPSRRERGKYYAVAATHNPSLMPTTITSGASNGPTLPLHGGARFLWPEEAMNQVESCLKSIKRFIEVKSRHQFLSLGKFRREQCRIFYIEQE